VRAVVPDQVHHVRHLVDQGQVQVQDRQWPRPKLGCLIQSRVKMFEKRPDIQTFLADSGLGRFSGEIVALCKPCVCFVEAAARTGGTRFGGEPDVPADFQWPERAAYAHGQHLADHLAGRGEGFASQFTVEAPLDFLCQIDLTDKGVGTSLADMLPNEGRLLFFWDGGCGPWIEGADAARVIWDTTPAARLTRRPRPKALMDYLSRDDRAGFTRAANAAALPAWSMPDRFLIRDIAQTQELRDATEDEENDCFWEEMTDFGLTSLTSGREVLPHRLGGWPVPEQWDPRFTAAASANGFLQLFDRSPSEAEVATCTREMAAWVMLLQVDTASLSTDFAEGTVYFVMRQSDLARRDFSRLHAIYQQT
jgi:uncharacterized protein YwqG